MAQPHIPPHIDSLLQHHHALSDNQESSIDPSARAKIASVAATGDIPASHKLLDELMVDKYIALERDKSLFVYNAILAAGATRIVEVGTSFGVSTIYLALACQRAGEVLKLRNEGSELEGAKVVATEWEASKAGIARRNWKEAGEEVEKAIELREGDLRETLRDGGGMGRVDFVLLDIWPHMALPALKLLMPQMRPGAVVVTDNTIASADRYGELLEVLRDPKGAFKSVTLPYKGGLEYSVYDPR